MPLFSVIIPVFNTEKYLKKCIKSVLTQKHSQTEIIIVEDCSTDKSLKICNSYKKNSLVKIIRNKKNLGVAKSRNNGIFAARGKYLLFLDSDDWLYPNCLSDLEKIVITRSKPDVIIGRYNSDGFPSSNKILFKKSKPNTFSANNFFLLINKLKFRPMVIWHYVVKKSFIEKKKLYFVDVKNGEDEEFGARLLCSMKSCTFNKKNYYWHRTHKQSGLRYSMDLKSTESYLKILVEYYKFISKTTLTHQKLKFINTCIKFALGEFSARIVLHNKKELKKLSKVFFNYIKNSKNILNKIKDKNTFLLFKNNKSTNSILSYQKKIKEKILTKVKNLKFKYSKIYVYCAAIHGFSTAQILVKEKFKIVSLIDDNKVLEKIKFMNISVVNGKYFLKNKNQNFTKILILVCQQSIKTYNTIARKLISKGIKKNQIIHIIY